jgi:putative ABC transport system permease protein
MNDLKFAFRQLLKNPGLTAVAVLTLALGIGANTAIFSVINGVLLKPLPYEEPGQLVQIWEDSSGQGTGRSRVAGGVYSDWIEHSRMFEALSAIAGGGDMNLTGAGEPEPISGEQVSVSFLEILRVRPLMGRNFLGEEAQPGRDNNVVILAHGLWQRRFGGDPGIVGRTIHLDGVPYTVVGVLPPNALRTRSAQFLIPFVFGAEKWHRDRGNQSIQVIGRLKSGVTPDQARAELKAIKQRLQSEYPKYKETWGATVVPLHEQVVGNVRPTLRILFGAVACVLLIACVNVANLLLARGAGRQRELAVRSALGAGRWRIVRQLLSESLLLALCGGILGTLAAYWAAAMLSNLSAQTLPLTREITVDGRVLAFSLGVSVLSGVIFGVLPAAHLSMPDLNTTLKEGGRGSTVGGSRLRGALVVSEIALALVLLCGAGLLLRTFFHLLSIPTGFDAQQALVMELSLPRAKYPDPERRVRFLDAVVGRLESLPGVEAAAAATPVPFIGWGFGGGVKVEGRAAQPDIGYVTSLDFVSGSYFRAMAIPLVCGRDFVRADNTSNAPRVCVFNEALAREVFARENPVGQRVEVQGNVYEVVGVVGSVHHSNLYEPPDKRIYFPYVFRPANGSVIVRTKGPPLALAEAVRKEIQALDPDLPVANVRTLEQAINRSLSGRRLTLLLLSVFAGAALALAAIGLYGVLSYTVTQRTAEVGIRMALGAERRHVLRLIVGQGLRLAGIGLVAGLIGALALTRVMRSLLHGVEATDPATFVGVTLLLSLVTFFACWLPARRAARIDPMEALRHE